VLAISTASASPVYLNNCMIPPPLTAIDTTGTTRVQVLDQMERMVRGMLYKDQVP